MPRLDIDLSSFGAARTGLAQLGAELRATDGEIGALRRSLAACLLYTSPSPRD